MRRCSQCGETKNTIEFSGNQSWCKECRNRHHQDHREEAKIYASAYRATHGDKIKEYREAHCEEYVARARRYYQTHSEEVRARTKAYREAHSEERKVYDREYGGIYREANRERMNERDKVYREGHREEGKAQHIAYHASHKEQEKQKYKAYYETHKAQYVARGAKRRAAQLQQTLRGIDPKELEAFYIEAGKLTKETGTKYSVDHIVPLKGKLVSGLHVPWNLQVIPLIDNLKKWINGWEQTAKRLTVGAK